jgi:hypothetical protein
VINTICYYALIYLTTFSHIALKLNQIGQGPYEFPSVFSWFLPEYIPDIGPVLKSQLVSPESMVLTMPNTIGLLNGMFSLIKYGLSDCHDGFGSYPGYSGCTDNGAYERSLGHLFYSPGGATISDYIDDLALLLTAGRLNDDSRSTIEDECSAEPDNSSITRCIQQLIVSTGEFHSTSQVSKSGEDRTTGGTGGESTEPYKAIVYFYLGGESNSFWSISHLPIPSVHLRLTLVQAAVTATTC